MKTILINLIIFAFTIPTFAQDQATIESYKTRLAAKITETLGITPTDIDLNAPENPYYLAQKLAMEGLFESADYIAEAYIYSDNVTLNCLVIFDGSYGQTYSDNIKINNCTIWRDNYPYGW